MIIATMRTPSMLMLPPADSTILAIIMIKMCDGWKSRRNWLYVYICENVKYSHIFEKPEYSPNYWNIPIILGNLKRARVREDLPAPVLPTIPGRQFLVGKYSRFYFEYLYWNIWIFPAHLIYNCIIIIIVTVINLFIT